MLYIDKKMTSGVELVENGLRLENITVMEGVVDGNEKKAVTTIEQHKYCTT